MDWLQILSKYGSIYGLCFAAVAIGIWPLLIVLRRKNILDHPNERSSHIDATPRGGGLVVIAVLAATWIWIDFSTPTMIIATIAVMIAVVSWVDDLRGLSALFRLLVQIAAVSITLWFAPFSGEVFQGLLPHSVDIVLSALAWLWFINLFNFMDGIDGISGVEALIIGLGVLIIANDPTLPLMAAAVCGVAAGFLVWNWHPAKIFLGDVGSAPLGYMLGWMLLSLAASGYWAAALILPGYYLADATIILIRRALRGERIWDAHKQHFYQKPVQLGRSHAWVSLIIFGLGSILIGSALATTSGYLLEGLLIAAISIICTLGFFAKN
jgi:UDP-N-acetylmuramyl pentapeptide phosphotransferase/UDP-N-acetylglucosamine-1-phosphate transferase